MQYWGRPFTLLLQRCAGSRLPCSQLTAQTRPLTSNDINTLVQGVRAAQVSFCRAQRIKKIMTETITTGL